MMSRSLTANPIHSDLTRPLSVLAIGYGNDLRSDDGLGQRVAERVASWQLPQVRSLAVHQLTPELAEPLSEADVAIFIDAYPATETQQVQVVKLDCPHTLSGVGASTLDHSSDPRSLLTLAEALYGHAPQAWFVAIPATNFEFGESFSPTAQRAMGDALTQIDRLIRTPASQTVA
ncbi:hydrogenase maturation protease [Phormidium sp. CCY1219]|uniref:hydrogenase maturation protease n=1 Tax=Phormidium sp. CCY1219 TaxID=2886104 RepID=UPI002D1F9145|nr:hydrogenase maturation protease [Phormidium sp. CCY1219]MEB3827455.1 hydrogenase maturation protease [Phormidium sp. CCY1219]